MRREQAAALTWGVCLTLAAIGAVIGTLGLAGFIAYGLGAVLA